MFKCIIHIIFKENIFSRILKANLIIKSLCKQPYISIHKLKSIDIKNFNKNLHTSGTQKHVHNLTVSNKMFIIYEFVIKLFLDELLIMLSVF